MLLIYGGAAPVHHVVKRGSPRRPLVSSSEAPGSHDGDLVGDPEAAAAAGLGDELLGNEQAAPFAVRRE